MGTHDAGGGTRLSESVPAVLMRLLEAIERGDVETAATLVTDDLEMSWPQSGERFLGRANALGALRSMTSMPAPAGEPRIVGYGDVWVVMMPLAEAGGISQYVAVYELSDGRVRRSTEYFAAAFAADPARARFAEPT